MTVTQQPYGAVGRDEVVSIRRLVNENVAEIAERFDDGDAPAFEFVCECGDPDCRGLALLTLAQYRTTEPGSVVAHD